MCLGDPDGLGLPVPAFVLRELARRCYRGWGEHGPSPTPRVPGDYSPRLCSGSQAGLTLCT